MKGRIKKALCCPSFPGQYTTFKEREGQGQLAVEHAYSREMLKVKRMGKGAAEKEQCEERFLGGKGTKRCRVKEMGGKVKSKN